MPGAQRAGALSLTAAIRQRLLNYLQRLYLGLPFNPSHGDSFTSCMVPVETSTSPYWFALKEQPAVISLLILTLPLLIVKHGFAIKIFFMISAKYFVFSMIKGA